MPIFLKTMKALGREMFLYYPGEQNHSPFKRCSLTVLMDNVTRESVEAALRDWRLQALADERELVLGFPVPAPGGWNAALDPALPDDVQAFAAFQSGMIKPDDAPLQVNEVGIPSLEAMLSTWHLMHDTRYLLGIGGGADMALTLDACRPEDIAAVLAVSGKLTPQALAKAVYAPTPLWLVDSDADTAAYFCRANRAELVADTSDRITYENAQNPLQRVCVLKATPAVTSELLSSAWTNLFRPVRRVNTGAYGDAEPRMPDARTLLECHVEEILPGDGLPHTWFLHIPARIKENPSAKAPLILFFHGGSDTPAEAAEMTKFHELGERKGFITCYPWGANRCSWNSGMLPGLEDDVAFSGFLIEHLIAGYPVDAGRVYLSGFSNGAAQAMAVAMRYPEKVAAICPIDSNWPGKRGGYQEVNPADVIPFVAGMERKKEYDFRMPVWYTYGSREPNYPVYRHSTQQHQYDFWKRYNHIPVKPTPDAGGYNPSGCGVTGDVSETLTPSARHPHHAYDVQRFFTADERPLDLYNYVIMREKGHEVAPMDAALGWAYVRRFRREPDGRLTVVERESRME